jgi:hypothetical protein
MSTTEESHFSKFQLDLSERIGNTALGRSIAKPFVGSVSPAYRQLDWYSRNITYEIKSIERFHGDPLATKLPRFWTRAAVMASLEEEVNDLKETRGIVPPDHQEAVAYLSDDIWHVGIDHDQSPILGKLNKHDLAIAMRLGKGPLIATMGLWSPIERHFVSVPNVEVINPWVYVGTFHQSLYEKYPSVLLT